MIIPGFPALLGGGAKAAPPFSLSGSWETGLEGWAAANGTWDRGHYPSWAHDGTWLLYNGTTGTTSIDYVLPADMIRGLVITCSVWHRMAGWGNVYRSLDADNGSGFYTLASANDSSMTYAQFSGSFAAGDGDATIRITAEQTGHPNYSCGFFDSWAISGALP